MVEGPVSSCTRSSVGKLPSVGILFGLLRCVLDVAGYIGVKEKYITYMFTKWLNAKQSEPRT